MAKVEAMQATLQTVNPDVEVEPHNINIQSEYDTFFDRVKHGGLDGGPVNLLLCCVDNYAARISVNSCCNELNLVWMESGVSEDALDGHIQTMLPGVSACFQCSPPFVVSSGGDERKIKRDLVCAASLPTTMGLVASLLAHNALKSVSDE
eukprot:GHVU01191977.1.p3 GENE.GHVU01191977.1~~GHVU01191977.1.p3  ORF type:complete len:150 (+),score=30.44 GHVU01191977.1:2623-3072(+)